MRQQFNAEMLIRNLGKLESGSMASNFLALACTKMRHIQQTGPESFSALGWEFRVGSEQTVTREEQSIRKALQLDLVCAPRVSLFRTNNDETATLVTCVPECAFRAPISCYNESPAISRQAQSTFVNDIHKLAVAGFYHQLGMSGFNHWHLHPDNGTVILTGWDSLKPISERERNKLAPTINSLFKLYEEKRAPEQRSA